MNLADNNVPPLGLSGRSGPGQEDTALHLAAMHDEAAMVAHLGGWAELVQVAILIEEGASLSKLNKHGQNPMHEAIVSVPARSLPAAELGSVV